MGTILQDVSEQFLSLRADLSCPSDETRGRPFEIFLMGLGHMFWQRGVSSFDVAAAMEGDSPALEEGLQRRGGEADIEPLMNQLIRDTVVMMIHFDVVIDIDLGSAPFSEDVAMNGQGFEGGFVQTLVEALAGPLKFFERTIIEDLQLYRNRLIEVCKTEEGAMP